MKVLFCNSIDAFSLSIRLQVEGFTHSSLDFKACSKVFPEAGNKLGTMVRDQDIREAMELEDILDEELGKVFCINGGVPGDQVSLFCQSTDDCTDGIEAFREREPGDEINRNTLPMLVWNWERT